MSKTQEIVDYLKSHPSFFNDHQDLLADMDLGGPLETARFHERQLKVLRERENEQKAKIEIIVDGAKANLQLEQGLHQLSTKLIEDCHGGKPSVETLTGLVAGQFGLDKIVIAFEKTVAEEWPNFDYALASQRVSHLGSVCDDRLPSSLLEALFNGVNANGGASPDVDDNEKISSCAFVPIVVDDQLKGMMILGSISQDRFKPGFGVMFLDWLGRVASAYLQPILP